MSQASKKRASQCSPGPASSGTKRQSTLFPQHPSTLPYTSVRDFAYPASHVFHYGSLPEPSEPPSEASTPTSENDEFVDARMPWESWGSDGRNRGHDIPPMQFGDGPPYHEDEDLQSPVVSTRRGKWKMSSADDEEKSRTASIMNPENYDSERGYYVETSGDGSERYYVSQGGEADGPGGDIVTYPPEQSRHSHAYQQETGEGDSDEELDRDFQPNESRYSRDYSFTITSEDEEFHGKAVALYDFAKENENELGISEGQIIWISYRHGHGWLVAEDPKTQESGLVPEEYVRLLRDIKGGEDGMREPSDAGEGASGSGSPPQTTQQAARSSSSNGYHPPVVSTFSTSSKDLDRYPTDQLGHQGQPPPQVVHYSGQRGGSQVTSPVHQHHDGGEQQGLRRPSESKGSPNTKQ